MSAVPPEPSHPPAGTPPCRCGALMQQSWWQELLEDESYQVERVDVVNQVAEVITISVSGPGSDPALYLTVADVDWPALLANFSEPVATRNGEQTAMLAHDELLSRLRRLLAPPRTANGESQPVAASHRGSAR